MKKKKDPLDVEITFYWPSKLISFEVVRSHRLNSSLSLSILASNVDGLSFRRFISSRDESVLDIFCFRVAFNSFRASSNVPT